jgi:protein arginine N-methyltransferase 5
VSFILPRSYNQAHSHIAEGISIPASYTAYLAPLSASKLYNDPSATLREIKGAETPYVVMFHAVNTLSGDGDEYTRCGARIQDCWDFEHPRKQVVLDPQGNLDLPIYEEHNDEVSQQAFRSPTPITIAPAI